MDAEHAKPGNVTQSKAVDRATLTGAPGLSNREGQEVELR